MHIILMAILGLIAGSFLTAFVTRLQAGKDFIKQRSACNHCQKSLQVLDLIPVFSYLFSKGKCRHCQKSIGWYYPVVETTTMITFLVFYLIWPFSLVNLDLVIFGIWLIILTLLIALVIYDLKWFILPNKIIYPTIILGLLVINLRIFANHDLIWWDALLGIVLGGGIFHIIFLISDKYIGYGDVRLGFLLGILLASWKLSFLMIFLSSMLGVLVMLPVLLIKGKQVLKTSFKIPYGPFLILAGLISFSFGHQLIDWYLSLI